MMTEEFVTLSAMRWLEDTGWEIIAYEYPQSGTGVLIRPDDAVDRTKEAVTPDILAYDRAHGAGLYFENKVAFSLADFRKIQMLRTATRYRRALSRLFPYGLPSRMGYGVAFLDLAANLGRARKYLQMVDFIIAVAASGSVRVIFVQPEVPLPTAEEMG